MATLALVHIPLVGPSTWAELAPELRRRGHHVATPTLHADAMPGGSYAEAFAQAVRASVPAGEEVVLVAHSGAGLFVPAISRALERIAGCIFVDATLPADGARWLDSLPAEYRSSPAFREAAAHGVVPNPWRSAELWAQVGIREPVLAAQLAGEAIDSPLALYEEPIAVPADWPAFPVAYLAFVPNPFYAPVVERARSAGWPVRELPGGHFEMLVRPRDVAEVLEEMLASFGR